MKKNNKKGQLDKKGQLEPYLVTFFIAIFILLMIAPFGMKILNSVKAPLEGVFVNISSVKITNSTVAPILQTGINFWDELMMIAFIFIVMVLVISAFLIDTHPAFVIIYIILGFLLMIFSPEIINTLSPIYDTSPINNPGFSKEATQLGFMSTIQANYGIFMVGIMLFTGIIIYGKIRFGAGK